MKKENEMLKPKFKVGDKVVYNLSALLDDVSCANCREHTELDYDADIIESLQNLFKLTIKLGDVRTTRSCHEYIYYEVEEIEGLTFFEHELELEKK